MRLLKAVLPGVLLMLLAGCGGGGSPLPTQPPLPTPSPRLATGATGIPVTSAPTVAPRQPASLTVAELDTLLNPAGSVECRLPCYGGVTPGTATLQDTVDYYGRLGIGPLDFVPGDYIDVSDGAGSLDAFLNRSSDILSAQGQGYIPPLANAYLDGGILRYLYMGWQMLPAYMAPGSVITVEGQPSRVELGLVFNRTPVTYMLVLLYEKPTGSYGFVYYGPTGGDASQRTVCVAPGQITSAILGSFAPGVEPLAGLSDSLYLLPAAEALEMPLIDVAGQLAGDECLEVAASQWGAWQALQP